ncbi:hypothetical protein KAU43_07690 [candidate division WOR-3 bacterium]|nr:hypothetical protein [candidate division WOR-3 bacterium]
MSADAEEEVKQRFRDERCPTYCNNFTCKLEGKCNQECAKLDEAQAMLCELCANPCDTEKQKRLMLNTKYYEEKKKLFANKIYDGVRVLKDRHYYLETRYKEVKKNQIETVWYNFKTKAGFQSEAKKIRFELELLRFCMDTLKIPYKKELDFDKTLA